ncbi:MULTISPECIES: VOC family protein [unclassified Rhizobium]|uniref:VOC family protein n=1 Tax=unclassified Rhizobium TaxID=2613769 RepID=UPI000EA9687D|nr:MULTISPECIES: VOC family protein [unclassified Rhizobium]AYG69615.1 glyoxalase/bleomycin resistance/extradiol dioxygenase family protein [Rhizobium sp. CCGE531]AYG75993.1 glyoxalase/bleomycin resistance/extradiol dioxygenase family protein [Rhizobium sp. CCGE532]
MRFVNPIPFVGDIARSKIFCSGLLGLKILNDFGSFVLFETGFAIHDGKALEQTVWKQVAETSERYGRRNMLLYFEYDDVDAAFAKIAPHVDLIHPVERQKWGQRVFCFYDPDGHAVEIGEPQSIEQAPLTA